MTENGWKSCSYLRGVRKEIKLQYTNMLYKPRTALGIKVMPVTTWAPLSSFSAVERNHIFRTQMHLDKIRPDKE